MTSAVCAASALPASSVLNQATVCSPSVDRLMLVPVCQGPPSTAYSVVATPERLSPADSVRVTPSLVHVLAGPVRPVVGGVRSIRTAGALVAVVERPAPLVTVVVLVRPVPSPEIVVSAGASGMPDSGSSAVQRTCTSPAYQPAAFGCVVGSPDSVGADVSPAGAVDDVVAAFPALSTAVPTTVSPGWTVREFVAEPSARQLAIPEVWTPPGPASLQVKFTVVVPSAFSVCAAVIDGTTLSTRTVTAPAAPTLPSRSAWAGAALVTTPSSVTSSVRKGWVAATPTPASVAVQLTVVPESFQPALLAAGLSVAATTGPVLSTVYDACVGLVCPVQWLLPLKLGDADTVKPRVPSPAGAVVVNVQLVRGVDEVWTGSGVAPVTSTHLVSELVCTVSVSAPPVLA